MQYCSHDLSLSCFPMSGCESCWNCWRNSDHEGNGTGSHQAHNLTLTLRHFSWTLGGPSTCGNPLGAAWHCQGKQTWLRRAWLGSDENTHRCCPLSKTSVIFNIHLPWPPIHSRSPELCSRTWQYGCLEPLHAPRGPPNRSTRLE